MYRLASARLLLRSSTTGLLRESLSASGPGVLVQRESELLMVDPNPICVRETSGFSVAIVEHTEKIRARKMYAYSPDAFFMPSNQ